jgi:NAD(P)-dependent dehydrogenase (short-subunit alcohol dehydrogenase family)
MSEQRFALVAGAGPGLGHALLRRFEAGGMTAVGLVRTLPDDTNGHDLRQCDLSDAAQAGETIGALIQDFGPPSIVVHNTAQLVIQPFLETTREEFEGCWRSMVLSAVILGQCVLQPMVRGGGGAFIVSGATASLRGGAKFGAFASAKFALRGLTQSLAREFQPAGIHVIHTVLDGIIDSARSRDLHSLDPSKMMKPDDLADAYWALAHQPNSAWSHEVDFRPRTEGF